MVDFSLKDSEARVAALRHATGVEEQREAASLLHDAACAFPMLLMSAGVAPVLRTALLEWEDDEAKSDCAWIVGHVADGVSDPEELLNRQVAFAEAGLLEPLVAFLPHLDEDGDSAAAFSLFVLTKDNPDVTQQLRDVPGVLEALEAVKDKDNSGFVDSVLDRLRPLSPSGRLVKPARAGRR